MSTTYSIRPVILEEPDMLQEISNCAPSEADVDARSVFVPL